MRSSRPSASRPPDEAPEGPLAGAEEAAHRAALYFAAEEALLTHPPRRRSARRQIAAGALEDFVVEEDADARRVTQRRVEGERRGRPPGLKLGREPAGAVVEEIIADEESVEFRHHRDERIARLLRDQNEGLERHAIAPVLLPSLGRVVGESDRRVERKVGVVFDREHPCAEAFQKHPKHPQVGRVEIDRDVIGLRRHPMPREHLDDVRRGEKLTVEIDGGVFMAAVEEQRPPPLMEDEIGDIRPEATGE